MRGEYSVGGGTDCKCVNDWKVKRREFELSE
jgi:hypothetical protein